VKIGSAARTRRLITVELIPDRVSTAELSLLKGRLDAITVPALRNGSRDPSYPTSFTVTPQQRSLAAALIVRRVGIEAVPSLTCRDCSSNDLAGISRFVEAGLENVLAVYGDPYKSGRDGYEFARTDRLIRRVSEEHGEKLAIGAITNQYGRDVEREVARTLARVDAGADFLLTNTVFDDETVLDHVDRLAAAGLDVPVLVQVSVPHSLENLVYVSGRFGIPVSDHLKRRLRRDSSAGIAVAAEAYEALRLEANGIHFSYLLRKKNPVPVYSRLLDRILGENIPVPVAARAQPLLPSQ
jgi:5,10-methylenetetrahydrofolate reductase